MFPWLVTAFAGQLECQELLLLWDRIIGFDSLDILAGTHMYDELTMSVYSCRCL